MFGVMWRILTGRDQNCNYKKFRVVTKITSNHSDNISD